MKYYFNIDDDIVVLDEIGTEFADIRTAQDAAVTTAAELLRNSSAHKVWGGKAFRLWATTEPTAEEPFFLCFGSRRRWALLRCSTRQGQAATRRRGALARQGASKHPSDGLGKRNPAHHAATKRRNAVRRWD
jgi:hypothetical protein